MDYQECLAYLKELGDEVLDMRFGLDTMRSLLKALNNPHQEYPSVLIAGTNGKGSVARFLNSVCTACGIRNGLYTSPHLLRIEERFLIDDQPIQSEVFARCLSHVVNAVGRTGLSQRPTYFETLTAVAFLYFSEQEIELAILEVGMGGRLDSTNVVEPLFSILTSISFDHQKYLGMTLEEIAREKAGILHPTRPALTVPQPDLVRQVLLEEASRRNALLQELDVDSIDYLESEGGKYTFRFQDRVWRLSLLGRHQVDNAALAVQASDLLNDFGFTTHPACVQSGIENTAWSGRVQKIAEDPAIVLDGAHNVEAARALVAFLTEHTQAPRSLVFGIMKDKDIAGVLDVLAPCFTRVFLTRARSVRAADLDQLKAVFPDGISEPDPLEALRQAAVDSATVVVAGSFYLVGEVLFNFKKQISGIDGLSRLDFAPDHGAGFR